MRRVYRNRIAAFIWAFTAFWNVGLGLFIWMWFREQVYQEGLMYLLMIGLFCLSGIGLSLYANRRYCTTVILHDDRTLQIVWRYPLKAIRRALTTADISPAVVLVTKDSEGDPYYESQFQIIQAAQCSKLPSRVIVLKEGHSRTICEQICQAFNQAAFS